MRSGVMAYLVKPFRRDGLLEALGQGLSWHEQAAAAGIAIRPEDPAVLDDWLNGLEQV